MSGDLDPRSIEREIARIREKESNPFAAGAKTNLFTLVRIRDKAGGTGDPSEAALQFLLGKRPARIITIERTAAARTEASVSGRCFPDRRNRGVCFEEVRIDSGDDELGLDPGAWTPLLVRDLPVYLWWLPGLAAGAGAVPAPIRGAAELIDKLIVDTSPAGEAAGAELGALARLRAATGGVFEISDFSWRRGRVLRELSARAFDPPEMRPRLAELRGVDLGGASRAEALLFFSWLSSRLGWSPAGGDGGNPAFRDIDGNEVRPTHEGRGPLSGGFMLCFRFARGERLDISCSGSGCVCSGEERGAYRFPSEGELLLEEVDSLSRDAIFPEVLDHAGTLLA